MKTFLTLCVLAMVSAGLYGFVDMAKDVNNGTMIQYDRGDGDKSVTAELVRAKKDYSIAKADLKKVHFDFGAKPQMKKVEEPKVEVSNFYVDLGKSYSRSMPVMEMEPVFASAGESFVSNPTLDNIASGLFATPSAVITTDPQAAVTSPVVTESIVTVAPPAVVTVDPTIAQPLTDATAEVKTDSVPKIEPKEEQFDYRDFSRGEPRKSKKKKHK
jgi:hypothetical protein